MTNSNTDNIARLTFEKGRHRLIAAGLIVAALAGAVGCVAADVL
jgi:hypothetical protein